MSRRISIGVFGSDSDIGAITAAVHEKANFTLTFPDGAIKEITLGEHASCYRSSVILPGRKHPVRHLVAISEQLHANGSAGRTILSRKSPNEAWAWLSTFLGLPAVPDGQSTSAGLLKPKAASSHFTASVVSLCWLRPRPMRCSPGSRRR